MQTEPTWRTIAWHDGRVRLLDQTALPGAMRYVELSHWRAVADAIRTMIVRGAPAIGCTAALGLALGAGAIATTDRATFLEELLLRQRYSCMSRLAPRWYVLRDSKCHATLPLPE